MTTGSNIPRNQYVGNGAATSFTKFARKTLEAAGLSPDVLRDEADVEARLEAAAQQQQDAADLEATTQAMGAMGQMAPAIQAQRQNQNAKRA